MPTRRKSHWEDPHAVYRMYDGAGACLYIGCSYAICGRMAAHGTVKPWHQDIARIEVTWHPTEIEGRRAESAAILAERPKYNVMTPEPDAVGAWGQRKHTRLPRGDATICPRCRQPKEDPRPGKAYCNACYRAYVAARRLRKAAEQQESPG